MGDKGALPADVSQGSYRDRVVINRANLSSGLGLCEQRCLLWRKTRGICFTPVIRPHRTAGFSRRPTSLHLWVSVPSGRVKSTGPQQCPADSAVTTSTLKASCGRWLHKALHTHTCPVHARVCFSPGTGMKGQSSEAAIGARQGSGPGSSQPPALYLSYFFIAVTEGTYRRKHLIGSYSSEG